MPEAGATTSTRTRPRASGALATLRLPAADLDRLRGPLVVGALVAAATVYVAAVDPSSTGQYLVCPLYALTGHYCAGCGALRATHDLAHGDLVGAWAMNPLWVVAVPLLVVAWLRWAGRSWRGPGRASDVPAVRRRLWVPWVVLAVTVAFTVLRNVPALAPWLAP